MLKGEIERPLTVDVYRESSFAIIQGTDDHRSIILIASSTKLCTHYLVGISGRSFLTNLVIGEESSHNNTLSNVEACFNISQSEDGIKEGLEIVFLTLTTDDSGICLGRDLASVIIPQNGGM